MNIDEFLNQKKQKIENKSKNKSKLFKYRNEILKLKENGCTFEDIQEFLKLNGINYSIPTIYAFYKRELAKEDDEDIETVSKAETKSTKKTASKKSTSKKKEVIEEDNEPDYSYLPPKLQENMRNYNDGELQRDNELRDEVRQNAKDMEKYF